MYLGQSGRQVRVRHGEHMRAIARKCQKSPVARYFEEKRLDNTQLWMIPFTKVVGGEFVRRAVESTLIEKYNLRVMGLNKNH